MGSKPLDVSGQRFGHLVVLERLPKRMCSHKWMNLWRCKCDCGSTVDVATRSLTTGAQTTCKNPLCKYYKQTKAWRREANRVAMEKHKAAHRAWYQQTKEQEPERVKFNSGTPKASRWCHDCGKPTNGYRCTKCLRKWRKKNGISEEGVENQWV